METPNQFGGESFIGFENITLVRFTIPLFVFINSYFLQIPIQKKLIDVSIMDGHQINWINEYHAKCLDQISPILEGDALAWLKDACSPL